MGTPGSRPPRDITAAIERYFQVSLFLLIAIGFASLFATGRLDPLSVLFVSIALVLRGYLLIKKREIKIPERWTNYLTLVYVLVFVVDLFLISGSYVTASVHLVLFSLVIKIFSIQRERDYLYLALLAFLAVLAASVLTVDSLFLASFIVFILIAVNAFVSMEIRRSLKSSRHHGIARAFAKRDRQLAVSLSTNGLTIVVSIVLGAGILFFLLPRFSAGYLSGAFSANRGDVVTGFTDHVNLGTIGRIQQTDAVVMHVQTDQPIDFDLKWRGVALTVFDGKQWKNEANGAEASESAVGRYLLRSIEVRKGNLPAVPQNPNSFRLLRYKVVLEPIGTNVIFLAPVPVELGGRFREISIDDTGSISNSDRNHTTESYEAVSQMPTPSERTLRSVSGVYPPDVVQLYRQLPSLDPRVEDLARQITANAKTDYDKAVAIERYLRENFAYTLQLPDRTPADPIANFLFVRKRGHCEYFASSMAVMLRTLDIPSRLVNGFRNGEYNDLTGSYIVRARNAHTWVEAYIPAVGWTAFDPTPAEAAPATTNWSRMRLYLDAAQEFWREWIINYDFGHQRSLTISTVTKAQRSVYDVRRWVRIRYYALLRRARKINDSVSHSPQRWIAFFVMAGVTVFLLWNFKAMVRALRDRAVLRRPSKSPQTAASIWYGKMLKSVARKGYVKSPQQTPTEFVSVIPEPALRDAVSKFTDRYERARFGDSGPDAEQLPELFEEIAGKGK